MVRKFPLKGWKKFNTCALNEMDGRSECEILSFLLISPTTIHFGLAIYMDTMDKRAFTHCQVCAGGNECDRLIVEATIIPATPSLSTFHSPFLYPSLRGDRVHELDSGTLWGDLLPVKIYIMGWKVTMCDWGFWWTVDTLHGSLLHLTSCFMSDAEYKPHTWVMMQTWDSVLALPSWKQWNLLLVLTNISTWFLYSANQLKKKVR